MISHIASAPPADGLLCQVRATLLTAYGPRSGLSVRAVPSMGPVRAAVSFSGAPAYRRWLQVSLRRRRWPGRQRPKGVSPELCGCARLLIVAGYRVVYVFAPGGGYLAVFPIAGEYCIYPA